MSDFEHSAKHFLQRWSQRKRAVETRAPDAAVPNRVENDADRPPSPAAAPGEAVPPSFDPATLPPIESITAASDIRGFLAPGVPEELARAALRRAWLADPAIRDFIGIAENQWDFTKPDSVPGFGSLVPTPELRRMVAALLGDTPADGEPVKEIAEICQRPEPLVAAPATGTSEEGARSSDAGGNLATPNAAGPVDIGSPRDRDDVAMQKGSALRRHGGAMPEV
jgi:hypothetical protein